MESSINTGALEQVRTDCLVVGVFEKAGPGGACQQADALTGGVAGAVIDRGDFQGRAGSSVMLPVSGPVTPRLLLVGLGKEADFSDQAYRKAVITAATVLRDAGAENAAFTLADLPVPGRDAAWKVAQGLIAIREALYRFDEHRTEERRETRLRAVSFWGAWAVDVALLESALLRGAAVADGADLARHLANQPGNVCTPEWLAEQAALMAAEHGLECTVYDREAIEAEGMHAFLAVARGSAREPRFVVLQHRGAGDAAPLVLVGKGITFDSGGISLKPPADMDEMKFDMSGAAAVLGTMLAVARLGLPLNVVGLVPACENMPDGRANKPGDVLRTLSGKTIEVMNTDAEGRLILADALSFAERYHPAAVVDVATLTGACVIALGHHASGLLSTDDALADELAAAGQRAADRAWRLPLWPDYQEQLKSTVADMANVGGRPGGTITAACFLSRFADAYPWAHLDIAGTAWRSGKEKGATGRPVGLLVEFLLGRSGGR